MLPSVHPHTILTLTDFLFNRLVSTALCGSNMYMPFSRAIEAREGMSSAKEDQQSTELAYLSSHYIVLSLLALVLVGTFVYLKRFKRWLHIPFFKSQWWKLDTDFRYVKPSAMRKVESLAFLRSSPPGDVERGSYAIRPVKSWSSEHCDMLFENKAIISWVYTH